MHPTEFVVVVVQRTSFVNRDRLKIIFLLIRFTKVYDITNASPTLIYLCLVGFNNMLITCASLSECNLETYLFPSELNLEVLGRLLCNSAPKVKLIYLAVFIPHGCFIMHHKFPSTRILWSWIAFRAFSLAFPTF